MQMQTDRNLNAILSEMREIDPSLTLAKLARLVNMFLNDMDLVVNTEYELDTNVVSGTRYYAIPADQNILSIRHVYILASNGYYKPIPEYIGATLREDV